MLNQASGWTLLYTSARLCWKHLAAECVMVVDPPPSASCCIQALIAYGLHFLRERGWTPVHTPYWLSGTTMARCAQLAQFDEELYRYWKCFGHKRIMGEGRCARAVITL
jgi:hypothetical protein